MHFELSLLKVPVTDLDRSVRFYCDGLGFEEEFVVEEYGWAQLMAGLVPVALYKPGQGGGSRNPGGSTDFHLQIDELEDLLKRLEGVGADVSGGIVKADDEVEYLEVADPDGNILRFTRD